MTDVARLWKWVQYYVNNWRQSPEQTQKILSALTQSYWQGVISWDELLNCERLLPKPPHGGSQEQDSATELSLALSQIDQKIGNEYQLNDICGFVDQGIVFKAKKGTQTLTLFCLTADDAIKTDIINHIPLANQLPLANIATIDSVLKTNSQTYLVSSLVLGEPLCAWLTAKYPLGLPKHLAQMLLQQIEQLLMIVRSHPQLIDSFHPGQLFIDPEYFTLQWVPCVSPLYYAMQTHARARVYQAPRLFSKDSEPALVYRLSAIAYELYTGCPRGENQHILLESCKELTKWQKEKIANCLSMKQSISWAQAATVFGIQKKKYTLKRSHAYLALVGVLMIGVWQASPLILSAPESDPSVDTVVIQQDGADQHINLLKAAFFKQIQENNIAGAKASWAALEQLLPKDDIFLKKIGPDLIAQTQTAAQTKHNQKSVQIPEPASKPAPIPATTVAAVDALPPLPDIVLPEIELPSIIVSPPKAAETADIEQQLEAVVMADPCQYALAGQEGDRAVCIDALSNLKFGPTLVAARINSKESVAITKQAISIADYNQYCIMSERCKPYQGNSTLPKTSELDLGLNDIEHVMSDYNAYCVASGSCEPLGVFAEPVGNLSSKQIEAYAAWLSMETGFTYRLPTVDEWQQMNISDKTTIEWLLDNTGRWVTTADIEQQRSHRSRNPDRNQIAFRLVREINS